MKKTLMTLVLPTVLAVFSSAPASAQIRLGVTLPGVHIHIAPDAPPPPRVEVRMYRPSRNHVWIGGYWDREDDRWAWAPGRWEEPSQRDSSWIRPQYQQEGDYYRYEPGHWSHQRMEEGEDYRRWRHEHGRGHGRHDNGRGHGWGRDKEGDRDRERDERRDH